MILAFIAALGAAFVLGSASSSDSDRYQLYGGIRTGRGGDEVQMLYRIDTATGQTWWTVGSSKGGRYGTEQWREVEGPRRSRE